MSAKLSGDLTWLSLRSSLDFVYCVFLGTKHTKKLSLFNPFLLYCHIHIFRANFPICQGPRLLEMKQHNLAAQTYLAVDMTKEAIDTFIMAEEWGKAKKVAREFAPRYSIITSLNIQSNLSLTTQI